MAKPRTVASTCARVRYRTREALLNIDLSSMQRFRIRPDKEVVGWRHSVAHGDPPDLSALDIADHVEFTANLLIVLADRFQHAMLERI